MSVPGCVVVEHDKSSFWVDTFGYLCNSDEHGFS